MTSEIFKVEGRPTHPVQVGTTVRLSALLNGIPLTDYNITWWAVGPGYDNHHTFPDNRGPYLNFTPTLPGGYTVKATVGDQTKKPMPAGETPGDTTTDLFGTGGSTSSAPGPGTLTGIGPSPSISGKTDSFEITVLANVVNPQGTVPVSLQRTQIAGTPDQVLWTLIRNRTLAIGFRRYKDFIDGVMCRAIDVRNRGGTGVVLNFTGTQAYQVLKQATDAFLMQECGVIQDNKCVEPVGFLDPDLMVADLTDPAKAATFLESEPRRYGRTTAVNLQDIIALRQQYYEQLQQDGQVALPYLKIIRERLSDIPIKDPGQTLDNCYGILRSRLTGPLAMELIWSYWHEEGMLVQTLNAILARFQNRRLGEGKDPLSRFDLDPLRPLANLFWGWVEDEFHRLTVRRRAFEYANEYGLRLIGRAVADQRTTENRSNFIESFHTLLHLSHRFFKEDDDTTVIADGFPLLNALRETHLILSEGAHNQFGDLPSTARAEMLIMQWLLARPEMRDFLGGRVMVPYEEDWMDRVDTMKQIQGWSDTSITHARDMGVFGEQLLLGIRYGNWSVINDPQQSANWARYWRPEIQRYYHAYRAATGVDLTEKVDATMPARLLQRRLASQQRAMR